MTEPRLLSRPGWIAHGLQIIALIVTVMIANDASVQREEDRAAQAKETAEKQRRDAADQLQALTVRLSVVESQQKSAAQAAQELKTDLGARITDLQAEVRATNRLLTDLMRSQRTRGEPIHDWPAQQAVQR